MKSALLERLVRCECCSVEVDVLHDVIAMSEVSIAKALMLSEVAQIARLEMRMQRYWLAKWRARAAQATVRARAAYAAHGLKSALRAVDVTMGRFPSEVEARTTSDLASIYRLARKAGWEKASGKTRASLQYIVPNLSELDTPFQKATKKPKGPKKVVVEIGPKFDLLDENALEELMSDVMIWIGRHYDANVRRMIRAAVTPTMLKGMDRKAAGKFIAKVLQETLDKVEVPDRFRGTAASYFEGLAANIATNARVRGQIRSFSDIGITTYEIVNPMDERTSEICLYMNGKVFKVSDAEAQIEASAAAKTPAELRSVHPWLKADEIKKIGEGGTKALAEAGLALPPYHFRCRSTVDVAVGSMDYDDLEKE